jgi:membrane protein YqaA with SNARE-associated domain
MSRYSKNYKQIILCAIQTKQVKKILILLVLFGFATLLVAMLFPNQRGLACLFWASIIANTVIPITLHEPALIYYGKLYSPQWVAIVATFAVIFIEYFNYFALMPLLEMEKVKIIREKRFSQCAERWFCRTSFLSILSGCLLPIPFFPFRILSVTTKYSIRMYILAIFIGRMPRYFLIAMGGKIFNLPGWSYIVIMVVFSIFILVKKLNERKSLKNESI